MYVVTPINEERRKKRIQEKEIVEGVIATTGCIVAFALIFAAPGIITFAIVKEALEK